MRSFLFFFLEDERRRKGKLKEVERKFLLNDLDLTRWLGGKGGKENGRRGSYGNFHNLIFSEGNPGRVLPLIDIICGGRSSRTPFLLGGFSFFAVRDGKWTVVVGRNSRRTKKKQQVFSSRWEKGETGRCLPPSTFPAKVQKPGNAKFSYIVIAHFKFKKIWSDKLFLYFVFATFSPESIFP